MIKSTVWVIISLIIFTACSSEPKPIEFGVDNCRFCDMTIIDNRHAAELVTTKGKVYKFDAIECMIRYSDSDSEQIYSHQLISDFSNPPKLVNAEHSSFLVSDKLPSPMGAFLSGFRTTEEAKAALQEYEGQLYNWDEIKDLITQKY